MTREFFKKVLNAGHYTTRKYFYIVKEYLDCIKIERIDKACIGFTSMLDEDNYTIVAVYAR